MMGGDTEGGDSEFERRTRALLMQSAEALPGAVRSRLTRARHAALAARSVRAPYMLLAAFTFVLAIVTLFVRLPELIEKRRRVRREMAARCSSCTCGWARWRSSVMWARRWRSAAS